MAGVFIGYDTPRTLGKKETGASVALPAFISFMKDALANTPNTPFRQPRGIQLIKVDLKTGVPVASAPPEGAVIDEAFITGAPIYIPGVTPRRNATTVDQRPANMVALHAKPQGERISAAGKSTARLPFRIKQSPPITGTGGLY